MFSSTQRDEKKRTRRPGRIDVTYTKFNPKTKRFYSGRTSTVIDLNQPWRLQAEAAVKVRNSNHHVDENEEPKSGFERAKLDKFAVGLAINYAQRYRDIGYLAVRGREQQLIDSFGRKRAKELKIAESDFTGGAKSDTAPKAQLTENAIRGVAKINAFGKIFREAANLKFGELTPYTGQKR